MFNYHMHEARADPDGFSIVNINFSLAVLMEIV